MQSPSESTILAHRLEKYRYTLNLTFKLDATLYQTRNEA
jgi:hypothetical protein